MDSISDQSTTTAKSPSSLLFLALILGIGLAFGLLFVRSHGNAGGSEVRIVNASDVGFVDVIVGGLHYGNLEPGQITGYQHWEIAYSYSSVSLNAAGKDYSLQPIDYVGEKPLGSGRFSYLLKLGTSGEIEMEVQADED